MKSAVIYIAIALSPLLTGCATKVIAPAAQDSIILAPGVGGDGPVYGDALKVMAAHGSPDRMSVFDWGYSWPLFFVNISSRGLHEQTERKLAEQIELWRGAHPTARICLIGHSAGAGVVLGALSRLGPQTRVDTVVLLALAMSVNYDIRPALQHATVIHVFYSGDDVIWSGVGPALFGTYDGSHGDSAGTRGFRLKQLDPKQQARVIQHHYESAWAKWGNDGGHFATLSGPFVVNVILPILEPPKNQGVTASGT